MLPFFVDVSLQGTSPLKQMLAVGHPLVEFIFAKDTMAEYTLCVCDNGPSIK
jgi:hypothetical protein